MTGRLGRIGGECPDCAAPLSYVISDRTSTRIPIDPMPHPDGNVAAMRIGNNLHGYLLTDRATVLPGYHRYRQHSIACPERPPAVPPAADQPPLFG